MKTITVRNVTIGQGRPKICVPIINKEKEAILKEARAVRELPIDLVEWRADWYEDGKTIDQVLEMLELLRKELGEIPILFTFRTQKEGGAASLTPEDYEALNLAAADSGFADLIDVEMFSGDAMVRRIVDGAHKKKVRVIGSNHDFYKTPDTAEIVRRLRRMQELDADIVKAAVMPLTKEDVLRLLEATVEAEKCVDRPIVTMAMGGIGVVSRIAGEIFGSSITFGAAAKASAPGQIDVNDLERVLEVVHKSQE